MPKQHDLFAAERPARPKVEPLALRMTPRTLDELVGQEHLLSPGKLLRRAVETDRLGSAIFYGPPGCGKSALVRVIAALTQSEVEEHNAVTAGVADIRKTIERAKERRSIGQKTLLLLDEIHHFNRTQQDALLPDVERGQITLIGLTTENPYFYVNKALLSRAQVFEFKTLEDGHLETILKRALTDAERGLGKTKVDLTPEAKAHLIQTAEGDARRLLNALELGVLSTPRDRQGIVPFPLSVAEESVQKRALSYDKSGDQHYDMASAFIKSLRGSDPDAALYWMARMLAAGEDPRFIARRLIISASEDVGNADPRALLIAHAALAAVEFVGMPEGRIPLAQAATYIAAAPKSNAAYQAIGKAMQEVEKGKRREVPRHLKDANLDRESLGHGQGYQYAHDFPGHFVEQAYWPDPVPLYQPTEEGFEAEIKKRLEQLWKRRYPTTRR